MFKTKNFVHMRIQISLGKIAVEEMLQKFIDWLQKYKLLKFQMLSKDRRKCATRDVISDIMSKSR